MADGVESPAENGAVQQKPNAGGYDDEQRHLGRDATEEITLTQKKKDFGKAGEIVHPAGKPFRKATEKRERSQRDNQGRDPQTCNQQPVQSPSRSADAQGAQCGHSSRQTAIAP